MDLTEYDRAEAEEWTRFVAVRPIYVGGVRAFNPDDAVPASHVTRGVVAADDVRDADAPVEPTPQPVVYRPFGADARPDPSDAAAAAEANREAGVS